VKVEKVTTVLDPDTIRDSIEDSYAEAKVTGVATSGNRKADIASLKSDFSDILAKKPGLTNLAQFRNDTGSHPPIYQSPYNIPQALIAGVNKELDWLKRNGTFDNLVVAGPPPWLLLENQMRQPTCALISRLSMLQQLLCPLDALGRGKSSRKSW